MEVLHGSWPSEFSHSLDPTRTWPGNFAVTHKTLPFGDVLECLLDLREDQRGGAISLRSLATVPSSCGSRRLDMDATVAPQPYVGGKCGHAQGHRIQDRGRH